jgi:Ca-activated chloride channel family protein
MSKTEHAQTTGRLLRCLRARHAQARLRVELRWGLCVLTLVGLTLGTSAQQPSFRAQTDLVALNVTVINEHGRAVRGLTLDSFTVMEDGKPQKIAQFASDPVPLSLLVAVDASESMRGRRFDFAREAVLQLVNRLGPDDEVGVFGFNDRAFNIQTWTRSRDSVAQALQQVKPTGYTALYGAVSIGLDAFQTARHRRQAMIVISDGDDRLPGDVIRSGDFKPAHRRALPVLERAVHSEALIYAVGVDAPTDGPYAVDPVALRKLTDPTGGMTQVVSSDRAVVGAAERIGDELRQQYVIGFVSDRPKDGKFHNVRVTVSGCQKCVARARLGYVADKPNPSP